MSSDDACLGLELGLGIVGLGLAYKQMHHVQEHMLYE